MEECQLQIDQGQLMKCIQLYNTILVRHGVVVLGPTGGGKSTVLRLLRKALNNAHEDHYGPKGKVLGNLSLRASLSLAGSISEVCGQADYPCSYYSYEQVFLQYEDKQACCDHCNAYLCPQLLRSGSTHCQLKCINPKSVSLEELYGCYNPLSLEWKIGVLAKVLSTFSHCTEMELQTLNETTPEDGDKDTNDAALEAVSDNSVNTGQSSVELSCHKLDLSHSTLGDGAEESSPLEEKGVCHPAGGSVVFFSYSTFIIELLSELLCTGCLVGIL